MECAGQDRWHREDDGLERHSKKWIDQLKAVTAAGIAGGGSAAALLLKKEEIVEFLFDLRRYRCFKTRTVLTPPFLYAHFQDV